MENYQTVGVFVSILGMFLGLIVAISFGPLGGIMFVINFITLILSVCKIKPWNYGFAVGILGLIGNLFLLIPALMAYGYKKKLEREALEAGA